ncbi:MAG: dihydroorotate dehydrogenase (quinone) [Deltaproteobacteria bacterium]|nr:dihydroorotate dehydrogenase (quinone) [Deltaproteobacteria bacterium]
MPSWYSALRPLLFRFDPERAHRLAFALLVGIEHVLQRRGQTARPWTHPSLQQRLWEIDFANPIGLAAGFDKDARAPHVWPLLGFGFAELGTITALAQPGNPQPRMFRLARDRAVITVNVSSPNTPGLRDLQTEEQLGKLVAVLQEENLALAHQADAQPRPVLIKVAPDLSAEGLDAVARVAQRHAAAGLVATNTTITRDDLLALIQEPGGLSGAPLRARSTEVIRHLYRATAGTLPIIGVGGIFDAAHAYEKIRAGATLVQLYTGMIFEGPFIARHIARGLVQLLQRDNLRNVRDAVGRDA